MVDLGFAIFAIGAVAGWSALFLRAPDGFLAALSGAGIWLAWALLAYGLARHIGVSPIWLLTGAGAGVGGHALLIIISKRGMVR